MCLLTIVLWDCTSVNFTLLPFGIAMGSLHDCYGVVTYHSMLKLYCMYAGMHEPLQVKQTQLLFLRCACINDMASSNSTFEHLHVNYMLNMHVPGTMIYNICMVWYRLLCVYI